MVGFQTRMTWSAQKEMIRSIPGLEKADVLRFGTIHRNVFLNIPQICDRYLNDRRRPGMYFAGQICGVEGYVESIASAMVAVLSIHAKTRGERLAPLPKDSMVGALMEYVHTPNMDFQPMNANMGVLPSIPIRLRGRKARRKARNEALSAAAVAAMRSWRADNSRLF